MMKRGWVAGALWLLVAVALLSGCAAGEAQRSGGAADAYVSPVPPAFRNIDPALRYWYTAPYFNPYEMP